MAVAGLFVFSGTFLAGPDTIGPLSGTEAVGGYPRHNVVLPLPHSRLLLVGTEGRVVEVVVVLLSCKQRQENQRTLF